MFSRSSKATRWPGLLVIVGLCACSGAVGPLNVDAGTELGPGPAQPDAGFVSADSGVPDAGQGFDAGSADAGSTPDAGHSACPSTASFCESFETGLDTSRWLINGTASAFTIDTTTPAADGTWRQELGHDPPEHWSPVYDNARWRFGVESFGPTSAALDVWFDAIVLSREPIGCL